MHHRSSLIAALCLAAPSSFAAQLESLGPGPDRIFVPSLISEDGGVVVGGTRELDSEFKVGVWTQASGLTVLDGATPDKFIPYGMSADGSVIIGDQFDPSPTQPRQGTVWDLAAGTRTAVGVLPGFDFSAVTAISADGSTVVGGAFSATDYQAYRWTAAGGTQPLAPSVLFLPSPRSISSDGTVVVGSTLPSLTSTDSTAAIWTAAGGVTAVPGLPIARSQVSGVSDDGLSVVGLVDDPGFPSGVFYYAPALGVLPVDLGGVVVAGSNFPLISADGSTVVVQSNGTSVRWSPIAGAEVLALGGAWTATSVSADGGTVTGHMASTFTGQDRRAFRWEDSGQVVLLDAIHPDQISQGMAVSRDGSTICGSSAGGPSASILQGIRWRGDGLIGEAYCGPAVPNSTGNSAELRLSGSNVIDRGELVLQASGLPSSTFGYFLVAPDSAFVTGVPGSQGNLCLGGAVGRFVRAGQVQQSSGLGEISLTVDPRALPSPQGTFSATPGVSLFFQAWFRDANPGGTSNFTSGAAVRFF